MFADKSKLNLSLRLLLDMILTLPCGAGHVSISVTVAPWESECNKKTDRDGGYYKHGLCLNYTACGTTLKEVFIYIFCEINCRNKYNAGLLFYY